MKVAHVKGFGQGSYLQGMGVAPDRSFPGWRSLWTRSRAASDAGQDIPEIDRRFSEYKYDVLYRRLNQKVTSEVAKILCQLVSTYSCPFESCYIYGVHFTHWSKLTLIPFLILRTFDDSSRREMIKEF